MTGATFPHHPPAPAWSLLGMEPLRALLEYASMRFMDKQALPAGDGHPVVIFPGLGADARSLGPLKDFCGQLGYSAYDWGRGFNTGPQGDIDPWLDELARHVRQLTQAHRQPISLIGWSLGGIYARELAKRLRGEVRQVITIGTPFAGTVEQTHASLAYRLVNGHKPVFEDAVIERLRTAPEAPTTSIYSRTDGVCAWQACVQGGGASHTENVEVVGSHCGLGWNAEVLAVIADRLRQPVGSWQPFRRRDA